MSNRSSIRSLGRSIRVCAFALLALGLFAPSAWASHCGWHVEGDARIRQELARLLEERGSGGGAPASPRCNGPSCSGQPAAPMPQPFAPPTLGDDWACTITPVTVEPDGIALLTPDETDARPVRRGPSIFHPPRLTPASA